MDETRTVHLLAMMVVFLLLIVLASVHAAIKRNLRMERKLDAVLHALGLGEEVQHIDAVGERHTTFNTLTERSVTELLDEGAPRGSAQWYGNKPK